MFWLKVLFLEKGTTKTQERLGGNPLGFSLLFLPSLMSRKSHGGGCGNSNETDWQRET